MSISHSEKRQRKVGCVKENTELEPLYGNQGLQGNMSNAQKSARPPSRLIGVNDAGLRVGESHPRAVLTDHEVQLLLELRAEGYSYAWLAEKFEISKTHAARLCRGQQRAQLAVRWKRAQ